MTMIMEFYHRWKETVNKRLLKFTKNSVCLLCLFWAVSWCCGNHGSHNFRRTNFKDFSRIFPRQITVFKDYDLFNKSEFLTLFPFLKPYWLRHVMESFTIFTSSAKVDLVILYYFQQQRFGKWLAMTCNCIWSTEKAFKIKKQRSDTVHTQKNVFRQCKVVNFKDFSRPNKEIKYFSKTLTEFKDFSRQLLKFKTFQDCTTMGNYCWFDSLSRCGVQRYCLVSFQSNFARIYHVSWSWFVQTWSGLEFN